MGGIRSVSLSASGDVVASGAVDGSVCQWNAVTGEMQRTLRTSPHGLMQVRLSDDARRMCVAGHGPVQVWSGSPLERSVRLSGHDGMVLGVALPSDQSFIATGGADGTLRLWNPTTGEPVTTLARYSDGVNNIALSGDGRLLAASVVGGTVELWSTATGARVGSLRIGSGHSSWAIALSTDGRVVACGGEDGFLRAWDTRTLRELLSVEAHAGGTLSCALSRSGQHLASSGGDGRVRLWALDSARAIETWDEHQGAVWAVDLSRDGQRVVSGGLDGMIRIWHVNRPNSVLGVRHDRPYERMDVTGLTGIGEAQRAALLALGAFERS